MSILTRFPEVISGSPGGEVVELPALATGYVRAATEERYTVRAWTNCDAVGRRVWERECLIWVERTPNVSGATGDLGCT